jgi:BTB/POZ domain
VGFGHDNGVHAKFIGLQVDGTLYCVHRYFFSRDSVYFSTRFAQLGIHDHEALTITISLGNVERKDFDAFLSILYPE